MQEWRIIKDTLWKECVALVDQRISNALVVLKAAGEAAQAEEKRTAGDKYETGRAMAHLEHEKATQQLNEALKLKQVLVQMNLTSSANRVAMGSLVLTDQHHFFVAISLGKLSVANTCFYVIAPPTPIGKLLMGLPVGGQFLFNGQVHTILEII